jgi:hypothetical protein
MLLCADPATGLRYELIFEVVNPHGSENALREVEDFPASRRTLAGDEVQLVICVEMVLIGPFAELHAFQKLFLDGRIASGGREGREPVEI